jgi:isoleucyl-tRNA synthetase
MRRVPEVIDTWFDSGAMPFAQWHYPFENHHTLQRQYPADFIAEGVDQTRGWFYSLLAISTGLGAALPNNSGGTETLVDALAAPYRTVVVNDLILDADGVKMSKRLGNIVDPWDVVARHGADAVRMFLVASSQVWLPRRFDEAAIRELSARFMLTFKHTYTGIFAQFANYGWEPTERDPAPAARPPLDRWMLSRMATVAAEVNGLLDRFEATLALRTLMDFVVDDVSNWYVRRGRSRFYSVDGPDNRAAFATLYQVLVAICRMLAPFTPFITDWMHRALTGASVHLASFPVGTEWTVDRHLETGMAQIRVLVRLGRAAREKASVKVRQPLSRLVCVVPDADTSALEQLIPLLAQELNVKTVELASTGAAFVHLEAKPNFRTLGKRFGKRTPLIAQAVQALTDQAIRALERAEDVSVSIEGETHLLQPTDLTILRRAAGELVIEEEGGYLAALDPTITLALRQEGLARELVSRTQRLRKEAGLAVSDRVTLTVAGDPELGQVVQRYRDYISGEVLADEIVIGEAPAGVSNAVQAVDLDGVPAIIAIRRKD